MGLRKPVYLTFWTPPYYIIRELWIKQVDMVFLKRYHMYIQVHMITYESKQGEYFDSYIPHGHGELAQGKTFFGMDIKQI